VTFTDEEVPSAAVLELAVIVSSPGVSKVALGVGKALPETKVRLVGRTAIGSFELSVTVPEKEVSKVPFELSAVREKEKGLKAVAVAGKPTDRCGPVRVTVSESLAVITELSVGVKAAVLVNMVPWAVEAATVAVIKKVTEESAGRVKESETVAPVPDAVVGDAPPVVVVVQVAPVRPAGRGSERVPVPDPGPVLETTTV
jgi:hypothetical protein